MLIINRCPLWIIRGFHTTRSCIIQNRLLHWLCRVLKRTTPLAYRYQIADPIIHMSMFWLESIIECFLISTRLNRFHLILWHNLRRGYYWNSKSDYRLRWILWFVSFLIGSISSSQAFIWIDSGNEFWDRN